MTNVLMTYSLNKKTKKTYSISGISTSVITANFSVIFWNHKILFRTDGFTKEKFLKNHFLQWLKFLIYV